MSLSHRLKPSIVLPLLAALLLLAGAPALGQNQNEQNPPKQTCGLPSGKSGQPNNSWIYHDVTYNLNGDCVLQGSLSILGGATVTINGKGYKITTTSNQRMLNVRYDSSRTTPGGVLTVNNLTIDGKGDGGKTMREMVRSAATLTMNNVTLRNVREGSALVAYGSNANVTLNNVLFENNVSTYNDYDFEGPALHLWSGSPSVTMNKAVFRDSHLGAGAISINNSGSVTANTCLGIYGNIPWTVKKLSNSATWTDNTGGTACSGVIGNKGSVTAEPALLACGLPGPGTLYTDATYTQTADCSFNTSGASKTLWRITEGATITFQQDSSTQYKLSGGSGTVRSRIWVAGDATVNFNNLRMNNIFISNWGTVNLDGVLVNNSKHRTFNNFGALTVNNSVFDNLTFAASASSASVMRNFDWWQAASATISNTLFSNINGVQQGAGGASGSSTGAPALNNDGSNATITLNGCISWTNVRPTNYGASNVTDNSVSCTAQYLGPELATFFGFIRPPDWDCLRLGAIGLICRDFSKPQAEAEIWGVNPDSSGYFIQRVTQRQVDAAPPGLVSASPDGRVAVRVWEDRNVTVQMGPTDEGKVHHVTLWHNLMGKVAGTIDTYGGPPGLDGLPAPGATAASVEADGVHVVKTGDTLHDIALRYGLDLFRLIDFNQLADGGHMIYPGQKLRLPGGEGGGSSAPLDTPAPLAKWVTAQAPGEDGSLVHVVQEGDTIWGIAVAYDMEPKAIMEINGMTGHGRGLWLAPGQRLMIRDGKTPPLASATST